MNNIQQHLNVLATTLHSLTGKDGYRSIFDGIHVNQTSIPSSETVHSMSQPGLCIVAQGRKQVALSNHMIEYDEKRLVVYAAEIPIRSKIVKASSEKPFLCLVVDINPNTLTDLIHKVFPQGLNKRNDHCGIYLGDQRPNIIQSANRLVQLVIQNEDLDLLVPLAIQEILIRLLRSPAGHQIAQIAITDSHAHKISRVISWLRTHYANPIKVEEMAEVARMSPSSFHNHFKAVTSMSPLQFQKTLRLQEARTLMLTQMMDVSSACYEVGYASVSQFSREYTRYFGQSPSKDKK